MFFNPSLVFEQNYFLNFVVSERGAGKTFSTLLYCVEKFLESGEQFVYLRRTETERDNSITTLLEQLQGVGFFTDKVFIPKGDYITCDGKIICYCHAISTAYKHKSVSFYKVKTVIFDEFIDENGRYIKNEIEKFLSFIETIGRMRDNLQIICLGNLITKYNPYFVYFKIKLSNGVFTRYRKMGILLYNFKSDEYRKAKLETPFGRLISGTNYGNFMLNNEAIGDDYSFIDKMESKKKIPYANIIIEGTQIVVFDCIDNNGTRLLFQKRKHIDGIETINYDKILVENAKLEMVRKMPVSRRISINISQGYVAFYDMEVKNLIENFIF